MTMRDMVVPDSFSGGDDVDVQTVCGNEMSGMGNEVEASDAEDALLDGITVMDIFYYSDDFMFLSVITWVVVKSFSFFIPGKYRVCTRRTARSEKRRGNDRGFGYEGQSGCQQYLESRGKRIIPCSLINIHVTNGTCPCCTILISL